MRCRPFLSRRMIRSGGIPALISSVGTCTILGGMSSGSCNVGHLSIGRGGALVEIVCNGCLNVRWHSFSVVGVAVGESGVTSSTENGVLSTGALVPSSDSCERPIDWSDGMVVSKSE